MNEFDQFIRTLSEGIRSFAKGMETIAEQLDEYVESPDKDSRDDKKEDKSTNVINLDRKKTPDGPEPGKSLSDTDTIYRFIAQSKDGIDIEALQEQSGFEKRKIYNIVYRLKKQGKIRSRTQGVYVKT